MKKVFSSYSEYLKSTEWSVLRRLAREKAENRCQLCGSNEKLHVHHREYPKEYGTEPLTSLVALCATCHKLFHDAKKESYKNERLDATRASEKCCDCGSEVNQWINAFAKKDLCLACFYGIVEAWDSAYIISVDSFGTHSDLVQQHLVKGFAIEYTDNITFSYMKKGKQQVKILYDMLGLGGELF